MRLTSPFVDLGRIASLPHELPERHRDELRTRREVRDDREPNSCRLVPNEKSPAFFTSRRTRMSISSSLRLSLGARKSEVNCRRGQISTLGQAYATEMLLY